MEGKTSIVGDRFAMLDDHFDNPKNVHLNNILSFCRLKDRVINIVKRRE